MGEILASKILVFILIFGVAVLNSSVGHGGASGYLAVLSLFHWSFLEMASTALILNVIVAGMAFIAFYRQGDFSWQRAWPFLVTSVPMAFVGGLIPLTEHVYFLFLSLVLFYVSFQLLYLARRHSVEPVVLRPIRYPVALASGAGIGLVSGMLGIGGGIFLTPLMLLRRWATGRQTAAMSAGFIVLNALAALSGRFLHGQVHVDNAWWLIGVGLLGGYVGSHWVVRYLPEEKLRIVLAFVLLIAAVKLMMEAF